MRCLVDLFSFVLYIIVAIFHFYTLMTDMVIIYLHICIFYFIIIIFYFFLVTVTFTILFRSWVATASIDRFASLTTRLLCLRLHRAEVLSDDARLTSDYDVYLSRTSDLSREQRGLGRLKLAQR